MRPIFFVVFTAIAFATTEAVAAPSRIVGGEETTIEEFPFMVSILYTFTSDVAPFQICAGALINPSVVLSGAYCFYQNGDAPLNLYQARVGSSYYNTGGNIVPITRIVPHEGFSEKGENDIAIVNLDTPADLAVRLRTALVAGNTYRVLDNDPVITVGWGWNGALNPPQLKRADINIVNWETCADRYNQLNALGDYKYLPNVTSNMLCVGFGNGPCTNDFGSPLLHSSTSGYVIVGITSWNFNCADDFYPDVVTRVSRYTEWILANAYDRSEILVKYAAAPRSQQRIFGGQPTTIQEFPFMSNMQYLSFGYYWIQTCGGSLITTRAVLSAAHCYVNKLPSEWRVRFGSSIFRNSNVSVHEVDRIVLHEHYSTVTIDNDVAIVFLETNVKLSDNVGLARIAGPNYILPTGTQVTVIGWGTLNVLEYRPDQLQRVEINLIDQDICAERYAYLKTFPNYQNYPDITDGMICAGILDVGGKDSCQGDSGGPVIHQSDVVVGLVSWAYRCADSFYPGVNTRVSYYSEWISRNAVL